jgi:hypothetical protein
MTQAQSVIDLAKKEVGFKEGANNQTKYGAWYGLDHNPWCAMFVSYIFNEARCLPLIAQSKKGYAGCEAFESWARTHALVVPVATVQAGDILLFDFSKSGKAEHTGIAIGYDSHTHLINTVEGNTADSHAGNQANGDGVYLKYRAITTVRAVVRPKWSN